MRVALTDEQQINEMIASREWWVLVGLHRIYEEIEERFYPDGFITIFGPPMGEFRKIFPDAHLIMLNFARKSLMSPAQLREFVNSHPERRDLPPVDYSDERDIIFITDADEEKK